MEKIKSYKSLVVAKYLPAMTGLVFALATSVVFADDDLSGALTAIKTNFGIGSVFIKALYLIEIYYGWQRWKETHNPLAVGGIVLIAMYLTYAIGKWVG